MKGRINIPIIREKKNDAVSAMKIDASRYTSSSESCRSTHNELRTPLDGRLASYGNMFDVEAHGDTVNVERIEFRSMRPRKRSIEFQVFTKTGSYRMFEFDKSGWTVVAQGTVESAGKKNLTEIILTRSTSTRIEAGTKRAFYVAIDTDDFLYANGTEEGSLYIEDEQIQVYQGIAVAVAEFPALGKEIYSPRLWQGTLKYEVLPNCTTPINFRSPSFHPHSVPYNAPASSPVITSSSISPSKMFSIVKIEFLFVIEQLQGFDWNGTKTKFNEYVERGINEALVLLTNEGGLSLENRVSSRILKSSNSRVVKCLPLPPNKCSVVSSNFDMRHFMEKESNKVRFELISQFEKGLEMLPQGMPPFLRQFFYVGFKAHAVKVEIMFLGNKLESLWSRQNETLIEEIFFGFVEEQVSPDISLIGVSILSQTHSNKTTSSNGRKLNSEGKRKRSHQLSNSITFLMEFDCLFPQIDVDSLRETEVDASLIKYVLSQGSDEIVRDLNTYLIFKDVLKIVTDKGNNFFLNGDSGSTVPIPPTNKTSKSHIWALTFAIVIPLLFVLGIAMILFKILELRRKKKIRAAQMKIWSKKQSREAQLKKKIKAAALLYGKMNSDRKN